MSEQEAERSAATAADPAWSLLRLAVVTALVYYTGARLGLLLTAPPTPTAILWPPNALLFGVLALTPPRWWWAALAGAFPAHLISELHAGIPLPMALAWFASNATEAMLGALLLRTLTDGPGLATLRCVVAFCMAATASVFLGSFMDVALVKAVGFSSVEFGTLWQSRFFANVLASMIFVPVLLTWSAMDPARLRSGGRRGIFELATLVAGLLAVSVSTFDATFSTQAPPILLYLPLPFLIWAALRFGPALASAAFAAVAFLAVWGAAHGRGPFHMHATPGDALEVQVFLIGVAVPMLMLAASIEERRQVERKLRGSEELFSTAFRRGPDAVAISRVADGRIIEANDRWLALLGYEPGTPAAAIAPFAEQLDEPSRRRLQALARDGAQERDIELNVRERHGAMRAALAAVATVTVGGEPCEITILRDITEQRRAERDAMDQRRQLTHLTRVASLSDFSSTIAHELNQPLTAILANAQAALRFLQHSPPNVGEIRAILDEIADADKRAGLLIHHLRLLMKNGQEEQVQVDMNHLVKDVLDFIRGEFLMRGVELKTSYARDLPQVQGDRVQLQQVVLNLVVNACDAMQGQSQRTLSIGTAHGADGNVAVTVTDTGPGVPPEQVERIFEPFYTTKESGLGMGLPICRRIVTAHGGALAVQSRAGEGATFRLSLPPAAQATTPAVAAPRQRGAGSTPTTTAS